MLPRLDEVSPPLEKHEEIHRLRLDLCVIPLLQFGASLDDQLRNLGIVLEFLEEDRDKQFLQPAIVG